MTLLHRVMLLGLTLAGASVPVSAQRVVPVHQEPRHRLVFESPALRVLDVQILPGDTTLLHTHDTPVTYVTIGTSSTDQRAIDGAWSGAVARTPPPGAVGDVRAVLSYADRPLTHQVTNVGSTLFRLIAVVSRAAGSDADPRGALPGEAVGESRWFRHGRLTIRPGESTPSLEAWGPTVVVAVTPGRLAVELDDGWSRALEGPGDVTALGAGEQYRLRNAGGSAMTVVLVEVR